LFPAELLQEHFKWLGIKIALALSWLEGLEDTSNDVRIKPELAL
jgi:hypothetical protein